MFDQDSETVHPKESALWVVFAAGRPDGEMTAFWDEADANLHADAIVAAVLGRTLRSAPLSFPLVAVADSAASP